MLPPAARAPLRAKRDHARVSPADSNDIGTKMDRRLKGEIEVLRAALSNRRAVPP
jgi:hypothetical protein